MTQAGAARRAPAEAAGVDPAPGGAGTARILRYAQSAGGAASQRQASRDAFFDELERLLAARAERRRQSGDRRLVDRGAGRGARDRRHPDVGGPRPSGPAVAPATAAVAAAPRPAADDAAARPSAYLLIACTLALCLVAAFAAANYHLAPLLYSARRQAEVAGHLAAGRNYAVFDLNVDMRGLRREHIARLPATPEVIVLGASHWQEASAGLFPGRTFYNAHVHRDYYEDLLAVVEMLIASGRLPRTLIMSIRDMTFLPVARRTDSLWLTALPEYRAMAARLGVPSHGWFEVRPERRWLGLVSLPTLWRHGLRRLRADARPGPTPEETLPALDVLTADGSIRWSARHRARFTPGRTRDEVRAALDQRLHRPPEIDRDAVVAVDRLLGLLESRGVLIVLIHPPFNPAFYRAVQDTPYGEGLRRVEAVTAALAEAHGATAVGGFDPAAAGCTEDMFIDAEHSGPDCLRRVVARIPDL